MSLIFRIKYFKHINACIDFSYIHEFYFHFRAMLVQVVPKVALLVLQTMYVLLLLIELSLPCHENLIRVYNEKCLFILSRVNLAHQEFQVLQEKRYLSVYIMIFVHLTWLKLDHLYTHKLAVGAEQLSSVAQLVRGPSRT